MNRAVKLSLIAVLAVAGLWLGYARVLKPLYLEPRAQYLAQIDKNGKTLAEYRRNLQDHPRVAQSIDGYVNRTLGSNFETVDHRLRTRLNRIAEQVQLRNAAVGTTGQSKPRESPAKSRFNTQRTLRDEMDFHELEAWVSGNGTLEQVLALVSTIEAEPWIKRIDQLNLDPRDNGARFNVSVRLTTLFLPGRTPDPARQPPPLPVNMERVTQLASANPFRVPPPAPAVQPETQAIAAAPPPFPYDQWAITGIANSAHGLELWLLNRSTQESRRMAPGERLNDVEFVAANGETAEFRVGEQRFIVTVGQNLNDRKPVQ